jgi:hypothetical protein
MLAPLAALALAFGLFGTTVSVVHNHELAAAQTHAPVVEVQAVQKATIPNA